MNPIYFVLIFIQVLFGINFPASKIIVTQMDPVLWSNLRFFIAGIFMLVFTLIARRKHPKVDKSFIFSVTSLSILGMALGQGLFLIGLRYTTSINSAILITCIPILTLFFVVISGHEKLTWNRLVGFLCSFAGVLLMRDLSKFSLGNQTLIGDALVFGAAACFGAYLTFGKKFFMKTDNMWATTYMFLISGVVMGFFNLGKFSQIMKIDYTPLFVSSALYSIVGATLLTYFLNNWALKRAPSGNVAIFIYLQPIVAGIVGWWFLGETVTSRTLFCSVLIMAGLLFSTLKKKA